MNTKTLGDFFTRAQMEHMSKVAIDCDFDAVKIATELRPWLISLRSQLEPKGLLPEFAAYYIPFCLAEYRLGQDEWTLQE